MKYYKVRFLMDDNYEVVELNDPNDYIWDPNNKVVFQGTLSECAAWIQLKEKDCI